MIYKFELKDNPEQCIYLKGALVSEDGENWRIPTPFELVLLQEIEDSPEINMVEINQESGLIPFNEYSGLSLISTKEACDKAGLVYTEDEKGRLDISCSHGHELEIVKQDGGLVSVYCPVCKQGIVNVMYTYIILEDLELDILTVDLQDEYIWSTIDEPQYMELIAKLDTLLDPSEAFLETHPELFNEEEEENGQ